MINPFPPPGNYIVVGRPNRPQLESDLWSSRDRAEPTRIHLLHLLRGPGAVRADHSTNFLGPSFTARESLGEAEVN